MCEKTTKEEGVIVFRVDGISMKPELYPGDRIIVRKKAMYDVGDILAFYYVEKVLVHRLCKKEKTCFYLKGDNSHCVEKIEPSAVVGCAVLRNRGDEWIKLDKRKKEKRLLSILQLTEYIEKGKNKPYE